MIWVKKMENGPNAEMVLNVRLGWAENDEATTEHQPQTWSEGKVKIAGKYWWVLSLISFSIML